MKKPSVADCLCEIKRLTAENARLERLIQTQRPEMRGIRELEVGLRDLAFYVPGRIEELHQQATLLLPQNNEDLPSTEELSGLFSFGRDRVEAALKEPPSADAVDPAVASSHELTTRENESSDDS